MGPHFLLTVKLSVITWIIILCYFSALFSALFSTHGKIVGHYMEYYPPLFFITGCNPVINVIIDLAVNSHECVLLCYFLLEIRYYLLSNTDMPVSYVSVFHHNVISTL